MKKTKPRKGDYVPLADMDRGGFNARVLVSNSMAKLLTTNYSTRRLMTLYMKMYTLLNHLRCAEKIVLDESLCNAFSECPKFKKSAKCKYMEMTNYTMNSTARGHAEINQEIEDRLEILNRFVYDFDLVMTPKSGWDLKAWQIKWTALGFAKLTNVHFKWDPKDFHLYSKEKRKEIKTWLLLAKRFFIPRDMTSMMIEHIIN